MSDAIRPTVEGLDADPDAVRADLRHLREAQDHLVGVVTVDKSEAVAALDHLRSGLVQELGIKIAREEHL